MTSAVLPASYCWKRGWEGNKRIVSLRPYGSAMQLIQTPISCDAVLCDAVLRRCYEPLPLHSLEVDIASRRHSLLVQIQSLLPNRTPTFDDGNDLLRKSLGKGIWTTASALLLGDRVNDPHHCRPPSLSNDKRHWHLQTCTTAGSPLFSSKSD